MSLEEKLIEITKEMNDDMLIEIIDFAEFIKYRDKKQREKLKDNFIDENIEALKELATSNKLTGG